MTSIETHRLAFVASSKCSHIVKLLMFLFVLAKLLPVRHNLYGNSLDFKLKYMREKKNEHNFICIIIGAPKSFTILVMFYIFVTTY